MGAIWFRAPLTCLNDGARAGERETRLHTPGFAGDDTDTSVYTGEVVALSKHDFADMYFTVQDPGEDSIIRAIEQWTCPVCQHAQWAELVFRREDPAHVRFVSASAVPLTPEVVRRAHFVSRWLDLWVESNPGPETEWILEIIKSGS